MPAWHQPVAGLGVNTVHACRHSGQLPARQLIDADPPQIQESCVSEYLQGISQHGRYVCEHSCSDCGNISISLLEKGRIARSADQRQVDKGFAWNDFEYLVTEAYRRQGYSIQENLGGGSDGGIDLVLSKDSERTLVQCKNWKSNKVGVTTVRELFGVMTAEGAFGGVIVCSGHYTNEAIEFAKGKSISLIEGTALSLLIGDVQKSPKIQPQVKDTACPVRHSTMVLQTAKRGKNAG
jgi:Restriction endonuclease